MINNSGKPIHICLWISQAAVSSLFCTAGIMKLAMPVAEISKIFPWTGQVPEIFLRCIGMVDLAGGVGILLPSILRVYPRLAVWAASGCALLQLLAISFHASRGELKSTPFNFFLLTLCVFILWGRLIKAPILPTAKNY